MKKYFLLTFFFLTSSAINFSFSVNRPQPFAQPQAIHSGMTVQQFLSMDVKQMKTMEGKKLSWSKKLALSMYQKQLARKVRHGKLEANSLLLSDEDKGATQKFGLLSVIFSVLGLIFLFLPSALSLIGLVLAGVGFWFGLKGLKRDEFKMFAIIGIITSGLAVLLYIVAIL